MVAIVPRAGMIALLAAAAVLAATLAAGCTAKFTQQKFETIYPGMPDYVVERKLGPPQHRTSELWVYTSESPYYRADIIFRDRRVVGKKWSVEREESHPSTRPAEPAINH